MKIVWIVLIAAIILLVEIFGFPFDIIGNCKDNPFFKEEEFKDPPRSKDLMHNIHEFFFKLKNGDCKGRL